MTTEFLLDEARGRRIGLSEAVYCAGKSPARIAAILEHAKGRGGSLLLTRLDAAVLASCAPGIAVVNIDNGYGAACIAVRAIGGRMERISPWNDAIS